MARLPASGLRNAPEKRPVAVRKKKDPLDFDEFLTRWRSELGKGLRTVAELQRKKWLDFLRLEGKSTKVWEAKGLLERMLEEIRDYIDDVSGMSLKEQFREVDEFVRRLAVRIQRQQDKTKNARLKAILKRLRTYAIRTQRAVESLKQEIEEFDEFEFEWPEIPRKNLTVRKMELDTRLQVELAKTLAMCLRRGKKNKRISLERIARLVLMAYLAGELATEEEKTGMIRTHKTDRILTVRNIRDNLRYAKLHKARSFRRTQKRK